MMNKRSQMAAWVLALGVGLGSAQAFAASATADALQVVTTALSIAKVSDLNFGSAPQGDQAKTVESGFAEQPDNASFIVNGEANQGFSISLPMDGTVRMTTNGGGTSETEIPVNSFTSNPGSNGTLDANGQANLFVGATRDALLPTQVAGNYSGSFTVTVVY